METAKNNIFTMYIHSQIHEKPPMIQSTNTKLITDAISLDMKTHVAIRITNQTINNNKEGGSHRDTNHKNTHVRK
jgi:hypothetical protein